MTSKHQHLWDLWATFLEEWPAERVAGMEIEEYANANRSDAFIYWLEARTEKLGSVWGGSGFKFGIYCRADTTAKPADQSRAWGEKYAWLTRYGADERRAFATIRQRLTDVIDAVRAGNLARVEEVELPPALKWKVAFLYQSREKPIVLPIYRKEGLFYNYRATDPTARLGSTPYYVMHETLFERFRELGDVFEIAEVLWKRYQDSSNKAKRAWVVPLPWALDTSAALALCNKREVSSDDIDGFLENMLAGADLAAGDEMALLVEGSIKALAEIKNAEVGSFEWTQVPVDIASPLLVNPTSKIAELSPAERHEIWSQARAAEPETSQEVRYWKIAPGWNAIAWPEWQKRGIAAIGYPALGDLTRASWEEFQKRASKCAQKHNYGSGQRQVWAFREIRPGDRVVANQGFYRVLGIGTVVSGYEYVPGIHDVEGEDFPHQIRVRWDDVTPREVDFKGWRRTLIELNKEDFDDIVSVARSAEPAPENRVRASEPPPQPSTPCEPKNVILYGPPGTGKTYATRRRALELILGPETIRGMRDERLKALYDEKVRDGQIEFVTFHQSYGYEELVEGIRPVLDEVTGTDVRYELHDGVFKRIALRAAAEGLRTTGLELGFDELWDTLVRDLLSEEGRTVQSQANKTYRLDVSARGAIRAAACEVDREGNLRSVAESHLTASRDNAKLYWAHRVELGPEPDKLTYEKTKTLFARGKGGSGGNHYTALWLVYKELFDLSRSAPDRREDASDKRARVQQALDKPGPTTTFSFSAQSPQYVLVIDEINRGNMSKIFGELITLVEADKRLTGKNELKPQLAYSPGHRFAVPPNLHLLGTMNTADRSIALMDVALRRRFTFEELMPNEDVIREVLKNKEVPLPLIDLVADVFRTLNDRIRFLYDRDHQLGHSYFLEVRDLSSLRDVFVERVLPMLQEYFYGAWDKICMVLGCPYNDSGEARRTEAHLLDPSDKKAYAWPLIVASAFRETDALDFDHDDYEDRVDHALNPSMKKRDLADAELARAFLGALKLDGSMFQARLSALVAPLPAPGAP